jgi:hypothetical protein
MRRFRKLATGPLLTAAIVVSSPLQAMEIRQFDNMQLRDQRGYAASLDQEAKNVLSYDDKSRLTNSASRPMVTPNPDGTFTVGKEPPNGNSKGTKAKEGLVMLPQVVVPILLTPEKKQ